MSYLKPLFRGEAKCETIAMNMIFNSHVNLTHFHTKGFTLSLTSKYRVFGTGNSLFNWWNKSLLPSILCEVAPVPSHNIQTLHFFHFIKGAWKDEIYLYRREVKKNLQKHLIINLPSSFSEILMAAYLKKEHIKMSARSTCKKDQKTKRNVINLWCCLLRRIVLTSSFLVEAWTWKCHQCLSQVICKACSPHFSPKIQKTRPLLHYGFINK